MMIGIASTIAWNSCTAPASRSGRAPTRPSISAETIWIAQSIIVGRFSTSIVAIVVIMLTACCMSVGSIPEIPSTSACTIWTPASIISGSQSTIHSTISRIQVDAASIICGAPAAIPLANLPTRTIAVVHISSAHSKSAVTKVVIRLATESAKPGALFILSQKAEIRLSAASIICGANSATFWTTSARTVPTAVTMPENPPSLKASWSWPTYSFACLTTSFKGVSRPL